MINEKYSYKNFQDKSFTHLSSDEFNGKGDIVGSNFYQQNKPNSKIFPIGTKVVFRRCNLDNVKIPPDCILESDGGVPCSNRSIKPQNPTIDEERQIPDDWIVDENNIPIRPINEKTRLLDKRSVDPKDIQDIYYKEEVITKEEWDKTFGVNKIPPTSFFKDIPKIVEIRNSTSEISIENAIAKETVTYYKIRGEAYLNLLDKEGI